MPPLPTPAFRLDIWTAPAAAGGTRSAFLVDAGGRAAFDVELTRSIEPGRPQLTFQVAPDYHAVSALKPQQAIVRLTDYVSTGPDSYVERPQEFRVTNRRPVVRRGVGAYQITCVPLEQDLWELDLYREITDGGFAVWRYGATERTPAQILDDVAARCAAIGVSWIVVGTVTPTTPISINLEGTATLRAIVDAVLAALAAKGVAAEFQFTAAGDLSEYRLELVSAIAAAMPALVASTDANAPYLDYDEDSSEQVTTAIPFGAGGIDLRELQLEIASVDAGTGWLTVRAVGGSAALVIAVDDQFNGRRLFRESTGKSFAITDTSASPMRVRVATTDLASGLAAGERVSFRETEDNAGERRGFATAAKYSPAEVVSTLTGPPRIRTRDLADAGNFLDAANEYRDWSLERSSLVATLPTGDFDHVTGVFDMASAPAATPAADDWLWFPLGGVYVPATVVSYNAGTYALTLTPRYRGQQFTTSQTGITGVKCYRPVGTPMWVQASLTANNEFTVDAFTGGTPAATDVCELIQRCQGTRLVELTDPAATTLARRKVGTVEVPTCSGATNRVRNGDLSSWAGGSGDPPDSCSIGSIVGTVTRSRVTGPTETRYGGKAWQLAFVAGASAEVYCDVTPIHPVPGAEQVTAAVALKVTKFSGNIPLVITLYQVTAGGARTALGEPIRIYPLDTTVQVDAALKPALDAWYDAVVTNQSVAGLGAAQLQIGVARPAGVSNPACTVIVDAFGILHREGWPQASEGGVQWLFNCDATAMLVAGNEVLLDRAYPLIRCKGTLLDVFAIDAVAYAPFELVPGRYVSLQIPPLVLTRVVRLMTVVERKDVVQAPTVELERVRYDVARRIAAQLAPAPADPDAVPPLPRVPSWLSIDHWFDDLNYYIFVDAGPHATYSVDGGASFLDLPADAATTALEVKRSSSTGFDKAYLFRATSGIPGDVKEQSVLVLKKPYIPPAEPQITAVGVTSTITPCDGGGSFDLGYTAANMPGTETIDWTVEVLSGSGGGGTIDSGTGIAPGAFPVAVSVGLCPGAEVRITIVANDGGDEIASYQTTVTL